MEYTFYLKVNFKFDLLSIQKVYNVYTKCIQNLK